LAEDDGFGGSSDRLSSHGTCVIGVLVDSLTLLGVPSVGARPWRDGETTAAVEVNPLEADIENPSAKDPGDGSELTMGSVTVETVELNLQNRGAIPSEVNGMPTPLHKGHFCAFLHFR
jgi:hypothetical protein